MHVNIYLCDPWIETNEPDPVPPDGVTWDGPRMIEQYAMDATTMLQALCVTVVGGVSVQLIVAWLIPLLHKHGADRTSIQGTKVQTNHLELTKAITAALGVNEDGTVQDECDRPDPVE